jgi:hypothetical protein
MTYTYKLMDSPVGELKLLASVRGLAAVLWENDDPKRVRLTPQALDEKHPILREAERAPPPAPGVLPRVTQGLRSAFGLPGHRLPKMRLESPA